MTVSYNESFIFLQNDTYANVKYSKFLNIKMEGQMKS